MMPMYMKPEIKAKWVENLRSGKYVQGIDSLRAPSYNDDGDVIDEKFCCLGVLCDLYVNDTGDNLWNTILSDYESRETTDLPGRVVKWAGLTADLEADAYTDSLAILNDKGSPFGYIADVIEKHVLERTSDTMEIISG